MVQLVPIENDDISMILLVNMHLIKGKGVHWYQWWESLVPIENNVIPMVLLVNIHLIKGT